jgi:RNA polymerase sporulation-specific sigma factor
MDEKPTLVDLMYENKNSNPEELMIDKESTSMLEYELVRHLSDFEQGVLELYLEDNSYLQIAHILKKNPKSIDNAIQRIRSKLNKVLKKLSL